MNNIKSSSNRHYQIVVQGHLSPSWADRLGSMQLVLSAPEEMEKRTILRGMVIDQAELNGILTSLYELHCPLLSVDILDDARVDKD